MINHIKKLLRRVPVVFNILTRIKHFLAVRKSLKHTQIVNKGWGKVQKDIIGVGNCIFIDEGCRLNNVVIRIRGNNNIVKIKENCYFGQKCSIWCEGNHNEVTIDTNCSFTHTCHFCAQEEGTSIRVGSDCMFSNNIVVRTSDSHIIYDKFSKDRLNSPLSVEIGNHVWIAPNTKIMKGSVIPNGCIIGSDTTTSKPFNEENTLIIGRPAKVVRHNVEWSRENLF